MDRQQLGTICPIQARDWLKKHHFVIHAKGGSTVLTMERKTSLSGEVSKKTSG
jgi:hypothetical protein